MAAATPRQRQSALRWSARSSLRDFSAEALAACGARSMLKHRLTREAPPIYDGPAASALLLARHFCLPMPTAARPLTPRRRLGKRRRRFHERDMYSALASYRVRQRRSTRMTPSRIAISPPRAEMLIFPRHAQ